MNWLDSIFPPGSIAGSMAILSLATLLGLVVGTIRVRGISLGVAAVLFVALLFGWRGRPLNAEVVHFLRDFSLILFVYPIGLQVGPSFLSSMRADGLRLNLLAVAVVILGAVFAWGVVKVGHFPPVLSAGLYTGGFATTPGFAAAEEGLRGTGHLDPAKMEMRRQIAAVYSVAYPFGLLGPILLVLVYRVVFRVDVKAEVDALKAGRRHWPTEHVDIEITNPEIFGKALKDLPPLREHKIVLSRLLRGNQLTVPRADTVIEAGDVFRVVGPLDMLTGFVKHCGREKPIDLKAVVGDVERRDFVFTASRQLGRSLRAMDLTNRFGVTITRINRASVDLPATADSVLRFGDEITAVGPAAGLTEAESELGNSIEELNRPRLIPIFVGIFLGILVGSIPLAIPGLNTGLRIGLAGGPMLVAIVLSHFGRAGRMVWYMPPSANLLLRDFGMAVFLACVGLEAGPAFFELLMRGDGVRLALWAAGVTIVPMFLVAVFARLVFKMNFVTLCGLTAGAMTSSPTMLFANDLTKSTQPAVAYATVYPLAMLGPVICTQVLVALTV